MSTVRKHEFISIDNYLSGELVAHDKHEYVAGLVYAMVSRANLATAPRTVFGPRTYATALPLSRIVLRLTICRAWIRRYFPPVHPGAAWLPPEPTPTPAAAP